MNTFVVVNKYKRNICVSVFHHTKRYLKKSVILINGIRLQNVIITEGKVHEYVGMTLDWSNDSYVKITMYDFLEDILKEVDEKGDMNGTSPTPASDKLFETDKNSEKLSEKEADYYHRIVARLLFASKRARPDLLTAVSYLCSTVKSPTISDYNKLKRTIRYIR